MLVSPGPTDPRLPAPRRVQLLAEHKILSAPVLDEDGE